jgi:hypothetical protein
MTFSLFDVAFVGSLQPPALWTPAQISTALWLDASDSSTITTVSGAVSQWNDKSGNSRNAAEATNRPALTSNALNSKNVVTFDGINDQLTINSSFLATTNLLIVCVAKDNNGGQGAVITSKNPLYDRSPNLGVTTGRTFEFDPGIGNGAEDFFLSSAITGASWRIVAGQILSSNSSLLAVDGTVESSSNALITFANLVTTTALGKYRTGSDPNFGAFDLAEIVVLTAGSTLDARQRIEGYLAHKWGLTANLPNDHPYKTAAPTV